MTSPLDHLQNALIDRLDRVNALITEMMHSEHAPRIPEVTAHLINAGGKRLRPMLTLAAARMFEYRGDDDAQLATAVEFIHTATLLHDDVVDESDQRRGRATANLLWDNKSSVLVGDYLFSRSFQLMVRTDSLRVLSILADASATIAEGEVLQMSAAQDIGTSQETYLQVVRGKTAALFAAACEVGGLIAGASDAQADALRAYGDALGVSFQIVDDVLDYGGSSAALGKNVGDDFRERKVTLPLIFALEAADEAERGFWQRTIGKGDQQEGDLEEAFALFAKHGALERAKGEAEAWRTQACSALDQLPAGAMNDALREISGFVTARIS